VVVAVYQATVMTNYTNCKCRLYHFDSLESIELYLSIATDEMLANDRRTLWQNNKYKGFFDNKGNKGNVDLSLDLKRVSDHKQFALIYYLMDVIITNGNICEVVDAANNTLYIPTPVFIVSAFPNPLQIRNGQTETNELKVN
jgi:hypothetical protein